MKTTKKTMCLFLVVLMLLPLTIGCGNGRGNGEKPADTTTAEAPVTTTVSDTGNDYSDYPEEVGIRNYGDREFVIGTLDTDTLGMFTLHTEGYNGNSVNDAMFTRDTRMNEKYGINIRYELCDDANDGIALREKVNSSVQGETFYCDMISGNIQYVLLVNANIGTLFNIENLPTVNSEKPWWAGYIWDNVSINDKLYYTAGMASGGGYYSTPYAMACNIGLADKILLGNGERFDVFDMVGNGDWTLENFYAIIENYTDDTSGDGKIDVFNDRLAYAHMRSGITAQSHYIAAGMKFSEIDSDGELTIDITSEKVGETVGRLAEIFDKIVNNYDEESFYAEDSQQVRVFVNDNALFFGNSMSYIEQIKGMKSDYAIIPCPKSDKEQTEYYTGVNTWTPGFIGFAANIADEELVGYAVEMLGYESYVTVKPAIYDVVLCVRTARDPRQIEVMNEIYDGIYLDLNYINNIAGSSALISQCILDKSRSLATGAAGITKGLQLSIDKFVNDMK